MCSHLLDLFLPFSSLTIKVVSLLSFLPPSLLPDAQRGPESAAPLRTAPCAAHDLQQGGHGGEVRQQTVRGGEDKDDQIS